MPCTEPVVGTDFVLDQQKGNEGHEEQEWKPFHGPGQEKNQSTDERIKKQAFPHGRKDKVSRETRDGSR